MKEKTPTIAILGDSITEGVGASDKAHAFPSVLADLTGFHVLNYGISGTRIARQLHPSAAIDFDQDFLLRAPKMDPTADFVIVFGGTNDFGHGDAPLGEKGERTPWTFYGAVRLLGEGLIKTYGRDKLVFLLPLPRYQQDSIHGDGTKGGVNAPLSTYIGILKEVLGDLQIAFIDFSKDFPEPKDMSNSGYFADGLHPNDAGARHLAELFKSYLASRGFPAKK